MNLVSPLKFAVKVKGKKKITHYQIEADKKMIDEQLKNIQKQYGKLESQATIEEGAELQVKIENDTAEIENTTTVDLGTIQRKEKSNTLKSSQINPTTLSKPKGYLKKIMYLARVWVQLPTNSVMHPKEITLTITEANKRTLR